MGQNSSSERDPRPSRERNLPETTSSRSQTSNNSKSEEMASCIFSSHNKTCPDVPNAPNPIQKWLSMDAKSKEKHILHAKHCILTPYFLFSKEDECSGKVVSWLQQKELIPKESKYKLLSDQHISVADCAEEAIDMILSLTNSSCFLYNLFHLVEQTKGCRVLSDALIIANNCKLIKDILDSCNFSIPVNKLPKDDTELILLVLLNQALSHILKVGDHTDAFEQHVKDNHERCDALKLKGNSLFNAKKYTKACVCYSQAIKLRPFDAVLYGNRAQSYLSAAKYREALSDARRAICLNPSWEKGYFRYAKAYFNLGFLDRAIAINQQAQKRCTQTVELMQQAAMFTKAKSSSPSTQPFIKRQCRTSVEQQTSLPISVDDENEYQDLPDLMEDSATISIEEELNRPGPSRKNRAGKARVRKMKQESEGAVCSKKVQSSCSYCSPRITSSSRVSDVCDDHNHDCGDDDESLYKHGQYSRTLLKTEKESESRVTEDEACPMSIDHHPMRIDGEEIPQARELSWTNDKDVSRKSSLCGVHSCESSCNHYHMCDDSDDTCRDCKCLDDMSKKSEDSSCNDHHMSNNFDDKCNLHSLDSRSEFLSGGHDVDERSMSSCSGPSGVTLGNQHHMSDDSDEHPCENSSRGPDVVKKASEGVSSDDDVNDEIESDSKGADDEDECVYGLCHCDDDDDDDEWEDIEDDDDDVYDSDSMDCSEPSDDEDDDQDEDDDDDQIFNPFYHMLQSMVPPPIPPQLVFGSEILLLALIHQFVESHSEFQAEDTPPGALPEVIESLVKKKVSKELITSGTSCCICQNDYLIDEIITCLPCNHVYHSPCIITWLKMHATCPTCRDVLQH